ncbi:type 12 methyltransferase [Sporocytophaga myxococcoides]|uniref:Small RNA 2'-O-methyltransferase n=2 Tax=Sporocytophaga myxococcoides TaxID=153721 RepID=A0A098LBM0_9BACT|nr:type 12 methyltransferase [Sporocytophaga myxococcoides]
MSFGKMHVFYPESSEERSTIALLLDVDPIALVRDHKGPSGEGFALEHYVNDRPYVASSFMSVAISKAFRSAMGGICKDKPYLVDRVLPLEVNIQVLPSRGGEAFLRSLFEPLGYQVELKRYELDPQFPEWGMSRYFSVTLRNELKMKDLLAHLYVLIPVLDNDKHYWISEHEVQKLEEKGNGWLEQHPEKELIIKRYLKNVGAFTRLAKSRLSEEEIIDNKEEEVSSNDNVKEERKISLHQQRLNKALDELKLSGAQSVVDLGCGEGKLLKLLMKEAQFNNIVGMDVSYRTLENAKSRLNYERIPQKQKDRLGLIHGSLTYRDKRLKGFDAAAVIEVIEHLDLSRLASFERVVFESARPLTVVITTPNAEYNVKYESLNEGAFRHSDHRFEWTRAEFEKWASGIATKYNYEVRFEPIGDWDVEVGAPSQMGVFKIKN